ncbi:MAG: hypothetical protein R3C01_17760 [Planctomycetaceae bacterium]
MKLTLSFLALMLVSATAAHCAEPAAKQFLRYLYGAEGIELADVCHPSDDAWMLRGTRNEGALAELNRLKFTDKPSGITSGVIRSDMFFVETRDGKVDPAFNLSGIYSTHRQLVHFFVYACLSQNRDLIERLTTDATKVKLDGPKAASGELGHYGAIIETLPVIRSSQPVDDAKSKTVTYRIPLGDEGVSLTLVRQGGTWKVDTSTAVQVPLEFFFQ